MDDDNNPDRLLTDPPEFADHHHERKGSMSVGAAPNANGDEVSPINGDAGVAAAVPPPIDPNAKAVADVVNSEVELNYLPCGLPS
jgi:hypothetical protein